jgi:hypothetical protein
MTTNEIQVDGTGQDGQITFWEPSECGIADLEKALQAIGKTGLMPKASVAKSALKYSLQAFIDRSGLKIRGNSPELCPLAPEVVGYEARRPNRGVESNDPEFLFSAVADNGVVTIPKHNSSAIPQLDTKKSQAEAVMSSIFASRSTVFPTEMVSACIGRVIESLGGILVRKTGGNYFIPQKGIEDFEKFASALDEANGSRPEIVTYRFPLKAGDRSFRSVLKAVKEQASSRLAEIEGELQSLGTKKQRSNGKESRLNEVEDVKDLISQYQEILGVSLKEMTDMADQVAAAVSIHSALEFCA